MKYFLGKKITFQMLGFRRLIPNRMAAWYQAAEINVKA